MIKRTTHGSSEALRALAHRYLPLDVAERWGGLLRPAVRLEAAAAADIAAGPMGGLPKLSADVEWPSWEGHGPLSFIASVDCALLRVVALDIMLPIEGTLSFFYFDGQLDNGEALVLADDCESWAGACVLYPPAEEKRGERDAPAGLQPYPKVPLTARLGMTTAEPWHPQVRDVFAPGAPLGNRYNHPVCSQDFLDALWAFDGEVGHQIGGHAHSVQNPVEIEVAEAVMDRDVSWGDPAFDKEIGNRVLLAQFDTDDAADMMWGDAGALYWLIRPQDLAECCLTERCAPGSAADQRRVTRPPPTGLSQNLWSPLMTLVNHQEINVVVTAVAPVGLQVDTAGVTGFIDQVKHPSFWSTDVSPPQVGDHLDAVVLDDSRTPPRLSALQNDLEIARVLSERE